VSDHEPLRLAILPLPFELPRRRRNVSDARSGAQLREQYFSGKRVRRTAVIGTAEQYPIEESAQAAVRGCECRLKRSEIVSASIDKNP